MKCSSLVVLFGMLSSCSMSEKSDWGHSGHAGDTATAIDDGSEPTSDSGDSGWIEPVWYGLAGQLVMAKELVTTLEFEVQVFGDDVSGGPICSSMRTMQEGVALDGTPDESIFHWWRIVPSPDDGGCPEGDALPSEFYLGLGELHQDIHPAVVTDGNGSSTVNSLYGAYASLPGQPSCGGTQDTACVFGYAGTKADFAAQADAQAKGPLADGTYTVVPAYLFPIP